MTDLLIYSETIGPRLQYVCKLLFSAFPQIQITDDLSQLSNAVRPTIQYGGSEKISPNYLWIPASGLLDELNIKQIDPELSWDGDLPLLFPSAGHDLAGDLFSSVFYWASRYEEYLPFDADIHGRFAGKLSHAHKHKYLDLPVIDAWRQRLFVRFNIWSADNIQYCPEIQWTFDIDQWSAFKGRSLLRTIGGSTRDLLQGRLEAVSDRIKVLFGGKSDPYQNLEYLQSIANNTGNAAKIFLHLGQYAEFDKNTVIDPSEFAEFTSNLDAEKQLGIHPSYASNSSKDRLQKELSKFEALTGNIASRSRQHYLKLEFPGTYRGLMHSGISEDWTMGYADLLGFRAGTGNPFHWFDLERNEETGFVVHPFAALDVTLKVYLQYTPAEAIAAVKRLLDISAKFHFPLVLIWHNSSFYGPYGWEGWQQLPNEINKYCAEVRAENNCVNS
ncbi:MAG: hypothetical protein ABIV51_12565 [Saprospiraceae bacterium]